MSTNKNYSARGTAATSTETPPASAQEFLRRERERAQAAIQAATEDLRGHAAELADINYWTRRNPWATVGTSAAVGFLAAAIVVPPKSPRAECPTDPRGDGASARRRTSRSRSAARSLGREVLSAGAELGRFAFQNVFLAGLQAQAQNADDEHEAATRPDSGASSAP